MVWPFGAGTSVWGVQMPDLARGVADNETPVNPYSLLEAVNRSSDTAHTAWLIFIALMAYLMVAVAGVTHKDLLLETPVSLPILQVAIPLTQFFQFAPVLLVLFHLGLVSQLVLLARKTLEFDAAVRSLEYTDRRTHPLRLELHNFFFVQAVAGPHRSAVMGAFLHGLSWLTLVVLPLLLLLYIQVTFLPYHSREITWTHRVALVADVGMLVLIGVFLTRAETSFFQAFWRTTLHNPLSFFLTTALLALVTLVSFLIATIPDERLDRLGRTFAGSSGSLDAQRHSRAPSGGFVFGRADGSLFGLFQRNLVATDVDFVPDRDDASDDSSLNLRERDLRYARLDRSDLHRADLTGADLSGASLTGADLRGARLQCADVNALILTEDRGTARCARARGANLARARLGGARLAGVDLRGANLEEAALEGAELPHALLAGASFANARLDRADLTGGVQMQGANFLVASLQGADLTGALAQGADFSSAALQGAILSFASLHGATLKNADLEGADLYRSWLDGADLTGAKLRGADLRGSGIWMTSPPSAENLTLADLSEALVVAPEEWVVAGLKTMLEGLDDERLRLRIGQALAPLLAPADARKWSGSAQHQFWQAQVQASTQAAAIEPYRFHLTEHLARLMCRARWGDGAVATGVAKRAQAQQFRGDMALLYDRLKSKDCPASETASKKIVRDLAAAVDLIRSQ
jgi:uncharacterized protein YjbI with pentapeptide repeats